jgi:hypothetical protein
LHYRQLSPREQTKSGDVEREMEHCPDDLCERQRQDELCVLRRTKDPRGEEDRKKEKAVLKDPEDEKRAAAPEGIFNCCGRR